MLVEMRPLLDEQQVADILGLSARTLQAWRLRDRGPTFTRIHGVVRYSDEDVLAFIAAGRGVRRARVMA
jgi:DNA-binding transcriptional MerR regulator